MDVKDDEAMVVSHQDESGRIDSLLVTQGNVSVLFDVTVGKTPAITYWGAALHGITGDELPALVTSQLPAVPNNSLETPVRMSILPTPADGWLGTPGVAGSRTNGSAFTLRMETVETRVSQTHETIDITITAKDTIHRLSARITCTMWPTGLLALNVALHNDSGEPFLVSGVRPMLPLPSRASEILDFSGHWAHERIPQRHAMTVGTHLRANYRGRTGADSAYVYHVGTPGFGFQHGEVWAVHTAYSGNHIHFSEHVSTGNRMIGGGENLYPGECILDVGQTYEAPTVFAAYGIGMDQIASQFHTYLRHESASGRVSKVTLNVWEAVYFKQNLTKLKELAALAARVGIERFVLDDGWFSSRRDDTAGLGDWVVSKETWPDGLHELSDHVRDLGMDFGIWFEPEMVNLDSDLAREHPEWIMSARGEELPPPSRHQYMLNLAIPEAWNHVFAQMSEILDIYNINYIKWDQNRDFIEPGYRQGQSSAMKAHVEATYRLARELKARFPRLEIETCSSGGSKIDLGIAPLSDRFWPSDCNDPLERANINFWTAQLLPPEYIGSHVASSTSHTTGRHHSLLTRAGASALFSLGVEWDLTSATPEELEELSRWIAWHKKHRDLIRHGTVIRPDYADPALRIFGVSNPEKTHLIFSVFAVERFQDAVPGSLVVPGIDPTKHYRARWVCPVGIPAGFAPAGKHSGSISADPAQTQGTSSDSLSLEEGVFSGSALQHLGLPLPLIHPEQVVFLELDAI